MKQLVREQARVPLSDRDKPRRDHVRAPSCDRMRQPDQGHDNGRVHCVGALRAIQVVGASPSGRMRLLLSSR